MELYTQIAALPYVFVNKELLVCLITSRETKRLVIPKGWPKIEVKSHEMASIEAKEEAGLIGNICNKTIGSYSYKKKLHTFASVNCEVQIYPLYVDQQLIEYKENEQRNLFWLTVNEAAEKVEEKEFSDLLLTLEEKLQKKENKSKKKH